MPSISGPSKEEEARYRAESDLRTLVEAEEIRKDKARMKAAMSCAKDKLSSLKAVADNKDASTT